jgi:tyrosyl-tRNA synthetase
MKGRQIPKDLLTRGIVDLVDPNEDFRNKLETNPQGVVIKFGIDPTRPDIHLGHAVILRKLRHFQDYGCKIVFLIGDFTAQIGDPTGKDKVRPDLQYEEAKANMDTFLAQVGTILRTDTNVFSWAINSGWFYSSFDLAVQDEHAQLPFTLINQQTGIASPIEAGSTMGKAIIFENENFQIKHLGKKEFNNVSLRGLIWTLKAITHAQLVERDMFKRRIKDGKQLHMHEMLYPVLQGIDSLEIKKIYGSCDLEVGGTDQTFNMLMGRDVMKINGESQQAVMTFDILEGLDGKEKMSKSLDNYIAINDEPGQMYGKVMSIPDHLIVKYFTLCTDVSMDDIRKIERSLKDKKTNPKDVKMRLAREIVKIYHSGKEDEAEQVFTSTFSKKEIPADAKKIKVKIGAPLVDILIKNGFVASKSEFRRLVEEGAITFKGHIEEKKIIDPASLVSEPGALKIGKRRFLHIDITKNK